MRDGHTPTSNRAELSAWLAACAVADLIDPADTAASRRTLVVHTDSELLVKTTGGWVTSWAKNGWKKAGGAPVANEDLCRLVHAQLLRRAIRTVHVRAHTGRGDPDSSYNAVADGLAREATRTQRSVAPANSAAPPVTAALTPPRVSPSTLEAQSARSLKRPVGPPPRDPRQPLKRVKRPMT